MKFQHLLVGAWALFGAAACGAQQRMESTVISYRQPSLALVDVSSPVQERGGVVIEVDPPKVRLYKRTQTRCVRKDGGGAGSVLLALGDQGRYEVTMLPTYEPEEQLRVLVKITNRTSQVVRMNGAVIRLRGNDRDLTLEQSRYQELLNAVLTPGEQREFSIAATEWHDLPDGTRLQLGLYGVATDINASGEVLKRESFEWTFVLDLKEQQETAQVPVRTTTMNNQQAYAQGCT